MRRESLRDLHQSVVDGVQEGVEENIRRFLARGISAGDILDAMMEAMKEVGRKYKAGEYFLPDMVLASEVMKAGLACVMPELRGKAEGFRGKVLLGSVEGDVHDLGKSIVASMLAGAGYEVIDLGIDVPAKVFVQKAQELGVDVVGGSAYMTTTTLRLPEIHKALVEAGIREKVKFIIGGASTSEGYVGWAGADGWAENAFDAVTLVDSLLRGSV